MLPFGVSDKRFSDTAGRLMTRSRLLSTIAGLSLCGRVGKDVNELEMSSLLGRNNECIEHLGDSAQLLWMNFIADLVMRVRNLEYPYRISKA